MIKNLLRKIRNYAYAWICPSKAMILKGRLVKISRINDSVVFYLINKAHELNYPDNKKFVKNDAEELIKKIDVDKIEEGREVYVLLMQMLREDRSNVHLSYSYQYQRQNGKFVFLKKTRLWD